MTGAVSTFYQKSNKADRLTVFHPDPVYKYLGLSGTKLNTSRLVRSWTKLSVGDCLSQDIFIQGWENCFVSHIVSVHRLITGRFDSLECKKLAVLSEWSMRWTNLSVIRVWSKLPTCCSSGNCQRIHVWFIFGNWRDLTIEELAIVLDRLQNAVFSMYTGKDSWFHCLHLWQNGPKTRDEWRFPG